MIELTIWKCEKCGREEFFNFSRERVQKCYPYSISHFENQSKEINARDCHGKVVPLVWVLKSEHDEELLRIKKEIKEKMINKINSEFRDFIDGVQYPTEGYKEILKEFIKMIDDVFGGGVAIDKVKGTLSVSGDQHNNDTEKLGEGSIPSVPISVAPQNQIKGNDLDTCIKCGAKRKRFGGASFYYPERESGLCSNCFGGGRR